MKLLLVDATGYLFRAFFASGDFRAEDGHPTGAMLFLINMLRKLRTEAGADYEACIMDAPGKTFRHEMSASYKAQRKELNPDLRAQIAPAKQFIEAMGWPLICESGVEADDVMATLARQGEAAGMEVLIASSDKDLMQIVNSNIRVYDSMKGKIFDENGVVEKFGVYPRQIADYLAICGDSADNIKGVDRVGPKTAMKLLAEHDSLDGIIAAQDSLKDSVRKNFKIALDNGTLPLARQLTKIKEDVPLALALKDLRRREPDLPAWKSLCAQFQFTKLAGIFENQPTLAPETSTPRAQLITLDTVAQLRRHVAAAQKTDLVALDTETNGGPVMQAEMVGFSFCYEPMKAYYVPLGHNDLTAQQIPLTEALAIIRPLLESPGRKAFHNGKYDLHVFANYGLTVNGVVEDTKIAMSVMEPARSSTLASLAEFYLKLKVSTFGEIVDGKTIKNFGAVDVANATAYGAEDSEAVYKLVPAVIDGLDEKSRWIYEQIDRPLMPVLFSMERHGVCLDREKLLELSREWQGRILELEKSAFALSGKRFNLNSPAQVGAILFGEMKAPMVKKTKGGTAYSTDEATLRTLAEDFPLANVLLEHRGVAKLKGTYSDGLLRMLHPQTHRVHTDFNQTSVNTGRLSSSNPNLQNIPIRSADGRRIREAFVAEPGSIIVSADYSQIELRLMAHISGDEALIAAFTSGADVHAQTAAEIFAVPLEQVDDAHRRAAKAINFGLIYGMSSYGLGKALDISIKEAAKYIERYFQRYPGVARYMKQVPKMIKNGFVPTIVGRKIPVSNNSGAVRAAINAPMQGSAADVAKLAMIKVERWLRAEKLATKMVLQVHDELVFETPTAEKDFLFEKLPLIMENVIELKVPLKISLGSGENWGVAH